MIEIRQNVLLLPSFHVMIGWWEARDADLPQAQFPVTHAGWYERMRILSSPLSIDLIPILVDAAMRASHADISRLKSPAVSLLSAWCLRGLVFHSGDANVLLDACSSASAEIWFSSDRQTRQLIRITIYTANAIPNLIPNGCLNALMKGQRNLAHPSKIPDMLHDASQCNKRTYLANQSFKS